MTIKLELILQQFMLVGYHFNIHNELHARPIQNYFLQ